MRSNGDINLLAGITCCGALVLLLSFAAATISANRWHPLPISHTEKDYSVAASIDQSSNAVRSQGSAPDR